MKIDEKVQQTDFKGLKVYDVNEMIPSTVASVDVKTPYLKATVHPNTRRFTSQRHLNLDIELNEDERPIDLTRYTFPTNLRKLRIRMNSNAVINYNPNGEEELFDFNHFLARFPKLMECVLLFDCMEMKGPVIVPSNMVKFGMFPMEEKRNQIIDLSKADNLQELVLGDYYHERYDEQDERAGLSIIPPRNKQLRRLIIRAVELHDIKGLDQVTHIEELVIYHDNCDRADDENRMRRVVEFFIKTKMKVTNIVIIGFRDLQPLLRWLSSSTVQSLTLRECIVSYVTIAGRALESVCLLDTASMGPIRLADNITTVTVDAKSYPRIKKFPAMMKELRVGSTGAIHFSKVRVHIRKRVGEKCEISFVGDCRQYYLDEELEEVSRLRREALCGKVSRV